MAQTTEQVLAQVTGIVGEILQRGSLQLTPETVANEVKDWDSLNHIEIVVAVEKHFSIKFNFAELQKFKNVGEMCNSIAAKLAQKAV